MENRLDFLLADAARLQRRAFDERCRLLGVTGPQWRLLVTLFRNQGCPQITLADLLEVEPITLARMVDRLQEQGLVERRANPRDRRAWMLHLTERALPLIDELRAQAEAQLAVTLDGVSAPERAAFGATLEQIRANLTRRALAEAANG
jgi:DNA-binding MarR family transcriptional regulator